METKPPQLKDGSDWIDHEDCIVGDEEGLRNLISACEIALEKGEYYGSDLGDYVGIKKLESHWFNNPVDSDQTRIGNMCLAAFLVLIVGFIAVGAVTVFKWLF